MVGACGQEGGGGELGASAPMRRLLPDPGETTVAEVVRTLEPAPGPGGRPLVALNMVVSVDGQATLRGRSGGLGSAVDREMFLALRTAYDAVMAGAGTVRAEGYGRPARDERTRAERERRGLDPSPPLVVVSASAELPADVPVMADPRARVIVITGGEGEVAPCAAAVEYVRTGGAGPDLEAALRELGRRGIRSVLCEGGPHLNGTLLPAGLVDELFVTISPRVVGPGELGMVAGGALGAPVELEPVWLLEAAGELYARYRVRGAGGGD